MSSTGPRDEVLERLGFGGAIRIGRGTDNDAFLWRDDVVVRIRRSPAAAAAAVQHEAAILRVVASVSPIPVPEVLLVEPDAGAIAVRLLPGTSLLDRPPRDAVAVAEQLRPMIEALGELDPAGLPPSIPVDDDPPSTYLDDSRELVGRIAHLLSPRHRTTVERFLAAPPPPGPASSDLRLGHNDLGAEHILVGDDGVTVTGVIDWTDTAITDPAHDLGRLCRDLGHEAVAHAFGWPTARATPGAAAMTRRAEFHARCVVLEDLAYGIESHQTRYTVSALSNLERTFDQADV